VLADPGPRIQWMQSHVTGDKLYCVYIAPDEDAIRGHADRAGFPAGRIAGIITMIDPATAG